MKKGDKFSGQNPMQIQDRKAQNLSEIKESIVSSATKDRDLPNLQ